MVRKRMHKEWINDPVVERWYADTLMWKRVIEPEMFDEWLREMGGCGEGDAHDWVADNFELYRQEVRRLGGEIPREYWSSESELSSDTGGSSDWEAGSEPD